MIKYDDHVHLSPIKGRKINGQDLITSEEMIKSMDKRDIDVSVIMTTSLKGEGSNEEALEIIKKYPNRFMYMATFNLCLNETDLDKRIKEEKEKGAIGIGELVENQEIESFDIQKLFKVAEANKMPILFHMAHQMGNSYGIYDKALLPELEKSLKKYKDLIIIGHSQPFWYEMYNKNSDVSPEERNSYPKDIVNEEGRLFDLLRENSNLYCDLSANSAGNAIMRNKSMGIDFLKEFQDRLIFGTDIYNKDQYFPLADYLKKLLDDGDINKDIYEKIFSKNFEKVFLH
ncbi:amidohydrolase family protein [Anaerococcus porci]|nr:amidohydrolase family protein [Anaerococcus porci]